MPKFQLINGQTANDVRLDRVFQLDWRSLDYAVGAELIRQDTPVYRPRSYTWSIDEYLDQGSVVTRCTTLTFFQVTDEIVGHAERCEMHPEQRFTVRCTGD